MCKHQIEIKQTTATIVSYCTKCGEIIEIQELPILNEGCSLVPTISWQYTPDIFFKIDDKATSLSSSMNVSSSSNFEDLNEIDSIIHLENCLILDTKTTDEDLDLDYLNFLNSLSSLGFISEEKITTEDLTDFFKKLGILFKKWK